MRTAKFKVFQGLDGQFYFRLQARNGRTILGSEGYRSQFSCEKGIRAVKENASPDDRFRQLVTSAGKYYFLLVAANGEVIGTSQLYARKRDRSKGIEAVKHSAGTAPVEFLDVAGAVRPITPIDPLGPSLVPSPLTGSVATDFGAATEFLYVGDNAVQIGVTESELAPQQIAVLRGQVVTPEGRPLSDVEISVVGHPEFGRTATRTDGMFDMAVNGGGRLTIRYEKGDHFAVQRTATVPWRDYVVLPDVVMTPADEQVTIIDLGSDAAIQVALGKRVSDDAGDRRAVLLFRRGTTAEVVRPDGTMDALEEIHVRATEFTIGALGPAAMPGELPASSGYTYAVEFTVDEATTDGSQDVRFSAPLIHYTENFLNFPVGTIVPTGSYDRLRHAWLPSENGRVIQVLSIVNGVAELDLTGSGVAADAATLAQSDITEAERQQLAATFQSGQSLWRIPIRHFTPWDCNYPYGSPDDAEDPDQPDPDSDNSETDPCVGLGSLIEYQNQVLGELLDVAGTPFRLHYRSDRVPGRLAAYILDIPLSGTNIPASLKRIDLEILVAGRRLTQSFPATADQRYTFTWDGKDGYRRTVQGAQKVRTRIGYVYDAVYMAPTDVELSFAKFSTSGIAIEGGEGRQEFIVWQEWTGTIGCLDARAQGLGGWSLNIHHAYDPMGPTLYGGDGTRRSARNAIFSQVIRTVAGSGPLGDSGDTGPATEAELFRPEGIAVGRDGTVYITDSSRDRVRRVGPDGIISTIAGTGQRGFSGDGGPATAALLRNPEKIGLGPDDDSLYIADTGNDRIRRVGADGIITTVAGVGVGGFDGDGGPATQAALNAPNGITVGPDGSFYIADMLNNRIRHVGPDGTITTVAGQEFTGILGDGGPAASADLVGPNAVELGLDGSLYIAEEVNGRVRRVARDGIISTVAGTGSSVAGGDGGPASAAGVSGPGDIAIGADGSLYIAETFGHRIRRVGPDGVISTVAGTGIEGSGGEDDSATTAQIGAPGGVAVGPDGTVYLSDTPGVRLVDGVLTPGSARVRRLVSPLPGSAGSAFQIPSEDALQVYTFDNSGRHLATLSTLTGVSLYRFEYDAAGRLALITDGDGNITRIDRDGDGNATAIVGPFGHRTSLSITADGYLAGITNPAGETTQLSYVADGLLSDLTDNNGNAYRFRYDDRGRLVRDEDPAGGFVDLSRSRIDKGFQVESTTALGRISSYVVEHLPDGGRRRVNTCACGGRTVLTESVDGVRTITYPDGVITTQQDQPDPRFGMNAPLLKQAIVRTPGGFESTISATRELTLAETDDPLSLIDLADTVVSSGRTGITNYDAVQRQLVYVTPEGHRRAVTLDVLGRVLNARVDGREPLGFTYDQRGRLATVVHGNQTFTHSFDADGRLAAISDTGGNRIQYGYDDAGRLTELTQPSGRIYGFAYDPVGNIAEVVMPSGAVHGLRYTAVGLGASYTPPDNGSYEIRYNQDRQPTQVVLPSGRVVDDDYDSCGRLERKSYLEARIELAYDGVTEQIAEISRFPIGGGEAQRLTFVHDGDVLMGIATEGAANGRYSYRYDNNLLLVASSLDGGPETELGYDSDGLITGLGPFTVTREGPAGAPSQIRDSSMTIDLEYDAVGRVSVRTHTVNGREIYRAQFGYDDVGRINKKSETVDGVATVYDYHYGQDGDLLQVERGGVLVEDYGYDDNGNRTSRQLGAGQLETARYDVQDRLMQRGSDIHRFDPDGFLMQRGADVYNYSARGELLGVTLASGEEINYTYDGLGRRVARTDGSGTEQYLFGNPLDAVQITAMRDRSGVLSEYYYDETGLLFAIRRGATLHYVATDQVGTPRIVCNADGQVVKAVDGDCFGNRIIDTAPGFDLPIGFAGGLADTATGLVRFGFRDYDPLAGRWATRDPALFAGGQTNLFVYVGNNPVGRRDMNGLDGGVLDVEGTFIDLVDAGGVENFTGAFDRFVPGAGRLLEWRVAIDDFLDYKEVLDTAMKGARGAEVIDFPHGLFATKVAEFWADILKDLFKRLADCLTTI